MAQDLIYELELRLDKAEKQLNILSDKFTKTGKKAGESIKKSIEEEIAKIKVQRLNGLAVNPDNLTKIKKDINTSLQAGKLTNKEASSLLSSLETEGAKSGKTAGVNFGNAMAGAIGAILSAVSFQTLVNASNTAIKEYDKVVKSNIALEGAIKSVNNQLKETDKIRLNDINKEVDILFAKFGGTVSRTSLQAGFADLLRGGITDTAEISKVLEGFVDIASTGKSEFISLDTAVAQLTEQFRSERAALGETAGLTDEYISQILPRGLEILQAQGKLQGKKVDDLTKEERALAKVAGLQENFNLTQGNFNKQLESGALEQDKYNAKLLEMQQKFGEALKPIQILVFQALTPFLEKIAQFISENPQLVAGLTIFAGAFTAVAGAVLGLMSAFSILSPVIGSITALFGGGAAAGAGAGAVAGGTGLFGSIAALLGPIGWVVLAIGGIIAIIVSLYNNVEVFRNRVNSSFEFVKNAVTGLKDNFALNIGKIIGFFISLPIKLPFWIGEALFKIGEAIAKFDWWGVWNGLLEGAKNVGQKIVDYFKGGGFKDSVKNALKGVVQGALAGTPLEGKLGFATGGKVFGAGTGTSDSISAMLSKGEFVVNARSTAMFEPLLQAMNNLGNTTNNQTTNNYGVNFSKSFSNPNFLLT